MKAHSEPLTSDGRHSSIAHSLLDTTQSDYGAHFRIEAHSLEGSSACEQASKEFLYHAISMVAAVVTVTVASYNGVGENKRSYGLLIDDHLKNSQVTGS